MDDSVQPLINHSGGRFKLESIKPKSVGVNSSNIKCFRTQSERLLVRIECWINQADLKNNSSTWYGKTASQCITLNKPHYQPLLKIVTQCHMGALIGHDCIFSHLEPEYFPHQLENQHPGINTTAQTNELLQLSLTAEDPPILKRHEIQLVCEGMLVRQQVVGLNIDARKRSGGLKQIPVRLISLFNTFN